MSEPIKCRAAICYKEGDPLVIEDIIVPVPEKDHVRVKMISAGICASDAHLVWGQQTALEFGHKLPSVFGHEGSGIIESVGSNVNDLRPGDHVLTTFMPQCKQCPFCLNPQTNICMNNTWPDLGSRVRSKLVKNNESCYALAGLGTYAEYITVHKDQLVKIDSKANLQHSAVISCAVSTGYYSSVNLAQIQPGSTVAIWGIGAIGINAIQGAKANKAKHILAIDINPEKREMAMKFGATEFINPKDIPKPLEEYLLEKYHGIDFALDCFGHQIVIDQALKSLSPFGKFTLVGLPTGQTKIVYTAFELLSGRTINGGSLGGKKSDQAATELIGLYLNNQIMVDEQITHKFKLDQINEAFSTLKQGKCIRSLIIY